MLFLINLGLVLIYMTAWFVVGQRRQRLDVVDTAWGGGFILMALSAAVVARDLRSTIIAILVALWGTRLAMYMLRRSQQRPPDPRYEELSAKWPKKRFWLRAYGSIFLLQGALVYMVGLPITVAGAATRSGLGALGVLGVIVWLAGFIFEMVADAQLHSFRSAAANKGKVMQGGLWRYSRHPNYFGEIVQWWAIWLIAVQGSLGWVGVLGPLTITGLIVFVSGIPPIERRKRDNFAYQAYAKHTSVLIPLPSRR